MSSSTGPQRPSGVGPLGSGTDGSPPDGDLAQPSQDVPVTARAIAVRAGQLFVWVLVTGPIALVLAGLCLALLGATFALVSG